MTFIKRVFLLSLLITCQRAAANPIELNCEDQNGWHQCTLELEKISPANKGVEIRDLEHRLLQQLTTDAQGNFRYSLPKQAFFILVDAGPGHVFDIDLSSANYILNQ